jgi:hypothetical protein
MVVGGAGDMSEVSVKQNVLEFAAHVLVTSIPGWEKIGCWSAM